MCGQTPLEEARELAKNCKKCELSLTRTQVVWGTGPIDAQIMFVGEAPGKNEDLGGAPFSGMAGKVLDELLASADLDRSEVYITNVVKCRPPQNRNPKVAETKACLPYLEEQILQISPQLVVTLGTYATRAVLKGSVHEKESIGTLQGTVVKKGKEESISPGKHNDFSVLPLYHPAATMYDRKKKEPFLEAASTLRSINEDTQFHLSQCR